MSKDNLPGLTPVWLITFTTILACMLPIGVAYIYGNEPVKPSDWIGFAGNVLTAGIAGAAIAYAWRGITLQSRLDLISREEDRIESELPGLRDAVTMLGPLTKSLSQVQPTEKFPAEICEILEREGFQPRSLTTLDEVARWLPSTDLRQQRELRRLIVHVLLRNEIARRGVERGNNPTSEFVDVARAIDALRDKTYSYKTQIVRMERRAARIRAEIERKIE